MKTKKITARISVHYVEHHDEYEVRVKGLPDATYHTDDKQDALDTAKYMATLPVNQ